MSVQIQMRRGTAAQWATANTLLAEGEIGLELDTQKFKMGTGLLAWNSLPYYDAGSDAVTSVAATAPLASSGGSTPTLSIPASTGAIDGYLSAVDWNTFNGKQPYNVNTVIDASYVHTDNNYTTTEKSKLSGIAAGAEVNVNADWTSVSGDSQILNKPTLGTAAATDSTAYATAAQGTLADSALQPAAIGITIQAYSAILDGTTASFTAADETKLDALPDGSLIVTLSGTETLTNKTLTDPLISNYTEKVYTANTSTAITLDLVNGTVQNLTLTGSPVITLPTVSAGKSFIMYLKTGTGGFAITWASVKWSAAVAPTITSTASKMDIYSFFSDGINWYGTVVGQNYTP